MSEQTTPKEDNVKKGEANTGEVKKKKTFWGGFLNFLMMGGFIVVLVVAVGLLIGISLLFKCK